MVAGYEPVTQKRRFMKPIGLLTFVTVVLATFALMTISYGQSTQSARNAAQPPSKSQAGGPVTMTECEGTNNCATWTFLGTQGNGQWPSGGVANLSVERFDADTVVMPRRLDRFLGGLDGSL
jgi:hypothetical protein